MGKIILNGIEYIGGEADNVFAPVIYSDTERKIGVWRDNKPMYAKTVHISALPSSATSQAYPHNIANIDKICHYEGVGRASSGSTVTLNRVGMGGSTLNGALSYDLHINKTNINISVGQDRSSIEAYVTIWYTKTTDVAGSGDYNTLGVPTEHYSTNEQVIGTWIDGKPVYEKTIEIASLPSTTGSFVMYDTGITNMKKVVNAYGMAYFSNGNHSPIPYAVDNLQGQMGMTVSTSTGKVGILVGMDRSSVSAIVTIRYTKTTD